MDGEEFRREAHKLVDWMADYMARVEDYPVRAQVQPGDIAAKLPAGPPEAGEPMTDIFADFERDVLPGMTHWQHPSFFAYFPANSSPPSVLAEMLTATLGAQCMLWQTSPAATEMETRMMEWLRDMLGLPDAFQGVIQDSASSATLAALITARERVTDWRANEAGLCNLGGEGLRLTVYCSEEAHSSVEKAMKVAGYGRDSLRKIPTDDAFALRPNVLAAQIAADGAAGLTPACVVASIGTTGTGGVDPLAAVAEICEKHDIFLHVDAAWAGSVMLLPERRDCLAGIEGVDSFVFNPHKWLLTNFDCSALFFRDPAALQRSLALVPDYLKTPAHERVIDYQNWSVPLGRRFRALKLWFVIRSYGVTGLQAMLRKHLSLAEDLYGQVQQEADFEIVAPLSFALFNFRYRPPGLDDEAALERVNQDLLERLNASGALYLTQNRVRGRFAIRFTVGQGNSEERHVTAAWQKVTETARALLLD